SAAGEEGGEEVEEILGVDGHVAVEVGAGGFIEEGGEEVEEVLGGERAVVVEVGGAGVALDEAEGDGKLGGGEVAAGAAGEGEEPGEPVVDGSAEDGGVVGFEPDPEAAFVEGKAHGDVDPVLEVGGEAEVEDG